MHPINFKIKSIIGASVFMAFALAVGTLVSYGGWFDGGSLTPPTGVSDPLNTGGGSNQTKAGGLELNTGGAPEGLVVYGTNGATPCLGGVNNATGCVRLGDFGSLLPREKLDMNGNLKITGALKPNGNLGNVDQVLTKTASGMDWHNQTSWVTLTGVPSLCSVPVWPQECADIGYVEYTRICLSRNVAVPDGYGLPVRICYRSF